MQACKFLLSLVLLGMSAPGLAASLQVTPSLIDLTAPDAASTLTLRNGGQAPINVQFRVFRWSQSAGEDRLEPTDAVVASPPAATLAPGTDYVARIVRISRELVVGEEAYRVLIDEVPEPVRPGSNAVRLAIRYSVPVFFGAPNRSPPSLEWSVLMRGDRLVVEASNKGGRRLRVAALKVRDDKGRTVNFGGGLAGYALSRSTMRFVAPGAVRDFSVSGVASIVAQGDSGAINVTAPIHREH
jgi:fimbrial chaperone protein